MNSLIFDINKVEKDDNKQIEIQNTKNTLLYHNTQFKLPIEYHKHKNLNDNVKSDLEINENKKNILKNMYGEQKHNLLLEKYSSVYSLDKKYLKENQSFIKHLNHDENNIPDFIDEYLNFKSEPDFMNKYQYIQHKKLCFLNKNAYFLQCLGYYNFLTPVISLVSPILGLIVPYFILICRGIILPVSKYFDIISKLVYNNTIINGLFNFHKNSLQTNAYTLVSIFFYVMSVYNNIICCINFYNNINYLIQFIDKFNLFAKESKQLILNVKKQTNSLKKFYDFNKDLDYHEQNIDILTNKISNLCLYDEKLTKYGLMGNLLESIYEIFHNHEFHNTIIYVFYLDEYMKSMNNIKLHIEKNNINKCKFSSNKVKIKNNYYLVQINSNPVKNDIDLSNNLIITGPNASGKTTLIKSCILNLFLCQSLGYGCFDDCKTQIYDYFHSYLNIPDTSDRDSLFQSEARRCKEIYEFISTNNSQKHFCIFDEIYSGTNPNDAILCANIYLKGMNKLKNCVDFILTTHYIELCEKFEKNDIIKNKKMNVLEKNKLSFVYTYKLIDGISKVNGGYQILVELGYPMELLDAR